MLLRNFQQMYTSPDVCIIHVHHHWLLALYIHFIHVCWLGTSNYILYMYMYIITYTTGDSMQSALVSQSFLSRLITALTPTTRQTPRPLHVCKCTMYVLSCIAIHTCTCTCMCTLCMYIVVAVHSQDSMCDCCPGCALQLFVGGCLVFALHVYHSTPVYYTDLFPAY